ncbi:MAG: hypothetical protein E6I18_01325 [Chloroflexi bacterium]|nr:MAG: hypothetical protein E6I18_01325 [Chloroflexota bacterium]
MARAAGFADRLVATPWIALLGFLAVSQTAHLLEHVAQMVQIHVLHLSGANAQGIVGQLNIEWVHFSWNALVLVALLVLLPRFPTNPWLIAVTPLAAWHFVEHSVMIATYIQTGVSGTPGLLSSGGLLFGGLPIPRPDLHFLYNLVETIPLLVAWLVELRGT